MAFNIANMLKAEAYEHDTDNIELVETHISWVILTGSFAYKIKKPVNFGFLDFSTLAKRRQFCEQEIILNSRLAPSIYLDLVSIKETVDGACISCPNESDEIIEYAVKMRQFPQSVQLDKMLSSGELNSKHIDAIADMIAGFHQTIDVADESMTFGNKHMVYRPVEENFRQIDEYLHTDSYDDRLKALSAWSYSTFDKPGQLFEQRKSDGFIRHCHGDMHLRNMIWLNGQAMAFDCIEFNPELSWIDVISEVAFLAMDLQDKNQTRLANRFLNRYLESTGDYQGLSVMPFYLCYRATVRAKINILRLGQKDVPDKNKVEAITEFESYLQLAISYTQSTQARLIIMRGLSASGKSTVSQQLVDELGAIRIRSDVERKRIFDVNLSANKSCRGRSTIGEASVNTNDDNTGDKASADSVKPKDMNDHINSGIYSAQASLQTYEKLVELATKTITAGYTVIVDATFLKQQQREPFQQLAQRLSVPYIILEITAAADTLRQRIKVREGDVSDADLTILEHQLKNWQPLSEDEIDSVIRVDTEKALQIDLLLEKINKSAC